MTSDRQAEKENFGEASLGDAQAENPPADPEMLEDGEGEAPAEGGTERYGGDQDAEPSAVEPELDEKEEAERPRREAGQGEAEGFEEAEAELIEHASHGDPAPDPTTLAGRPERDEAPSEYGEADEERVSELDPDERTD